MHTDILAIRSDGFGGCLDLSAMAPADAVVAGLAAAPSLADALTRHRGLLVLRGLDALSDQPDALVTLARAFGQEVEDIRQTLTAERFFHPDVAEILVLSNKPGVDHMPPARPPRGEDGALLVQHPHQSNWHTDQSYRRPPPDVTLLFGRICPPSDQGQTLFADCAAAFAALPPEDQLHLSDLKAIHAMGWVGRTADDVRAGRAPKPLQPHQLPVRQPLVRRHPVSGLEALYLCEERQLDYVDGPVVGLSPGPDGEGAELIARLLTHATSPEFVHVHEWQAGDLVIADNRCLLHAATWYDAATHPREMWRCTVMGNPGAEYAGETKSWLPADGSSLMQGLENA